MTALGDYDTREVEAIERRLVAAFCPPLDRETVQRCLRESVARFRDAPVQTFVLLLAERQATDRLCALRAVGRW